MAPHSYFVEDLPGFGDRSVGDAEALREWVWRALGVQAGKDVTIIEVEFTDPAAAIDHCPPQATFGHRLERGRSAQLRIHYPIDG